MTELSVAMEPPAPIAEWLEPSLQDTAGQDPLGFNTITLDRILPQLIPGILQLSERARYFSIYPWMLLQFEERKRPATGAELDHFIRRREYELCLAMKLCEHCEVAKAIGSLSAGPVARSGVDFFQRGWSVESDKGGFGLYYRSPLVELGAVVPAGTPLGSEGQATPIEVLRRDERARASAEAFHHAIKGTEYYKRYERTEEPIPRPVLEDLAEHVCLCRLPSAPVERDAVRALMFTPRSEQDRDACRERQRAFALFLALLDRNPKVAREDGEFWRSTIELFLEASNLETATGETAAAWAAVSMKECLQDAICSIWTDFCRNGVRDQGPEGISTEELRGMVGGLASTAPRLNGTAFELTTDPPATDVQKQAVSAAADMDWEDLRGWAAEEDSAAAGLIALLVFSSRLPDPREVHPFWGEIAARRTEHQDGLLSAISVLRGQLRRGPSFAALMEWTVRRFLIGPHEVIAYSKLPRSTFRFSWDESGSLRFFTPGTGGLDRFKPSDDRRGPMSSLTEDIGFWRKEDNGPRLTEDGAAFLRGALG
jgi:hypothetical protein